MIVLAILLAGSLCFAPILTRAADTKAKAGDAADKEAQAEAAAVAASADDTATLLLDAFRARLATATAAAAAAGVEIGRASCRERV